MALTGALGLWFAEPWLFPSLGPTIFLQTISPDQAASRPWNLLVGHAAGVVAGFGCVLLTGAQHSPSVIGAGLLTPERIAATALAVTTTMALQAVLRAHHPPAAATTMLITLGGLLPSGRTLVALVVGVCVVCLLGEAARRWLPPAAPSS